MINLRTILCLAGAVLGGLSSAWTQTGTTREFVSAAGGFRFPLPPGWTAIPDATIKNFNEQGPPESQFQGGIVDTRSTHPKVYMLLQVRNGAPESREQQEAFQAAAIRVDALQAVADVIAKGEQETKSTFYSPTHDSFLVITEKDGRFSLIVKRFTDYGYYVMHFYLGTDVASEMKDIEAMLSGLTMEGASSTDVSP